VTGVLVYLMLYVWFPPVAIAQWRAHRAWLDHRRACSARD